MKSVSLLFVLSLVVCAAYGGVVRQEQSSQLKVPSGEELEKTHLLQLVETLSNQLHDVSGQRDTWLQRYQKLANDTRANTLLINELVNISRVAAPLIWNIFSGESMMNVIKKMRPEYMQLPQHVEPGRAPHPLVTLRTHITAQDPFMVSTSILPTAEANVGLRVMYEPEPGEDLDFARGDILVSVHVRWHFDYGSSREVAINERYNGIWTRPEVIYGGDEWPDLSVGEKFSISIYSTKGNCYGVVINAGLERLLLVPNERDPMEFCTQYKRQYDPRKLVVTVNEDVPRAGQIIPLFTNYQPYD